MKVSTSEPFQIIYSIFNLEFLGPLFQAYIVQLDDNGKPTLLNQNVSSKNLIEFDAGLDQNDYALVKLTESMQKDAIIKKFNTRKISANDFLLKTFDPEKGDKLVREAIRDFLDQRKAKVLELLLTKEVYISSNDGNPAWQRVDVKQEPATVLFHLFRNADNTHYFPTIRHNQEKVEFQYKNGILLCEEPAWLLINHSLYHFQDNLDGKKLKPFLEKKFIPIPKSMEEEYFRKFVTPLIAAHSVSAKGLEIINLSLPVEPILYFAEIGASTIPAPSLFDQTATQSLPESDTRINWKLAFRYGEFSFQFDSFAAPYHVSMEKTDESYRFHKIRRDLKQEKEVLKYLKERGLDMRISQSTMGKIEAFVWLDRNKEALQKEGILVEQTITDGKRYFLGYSKMDVSISENESNDWFDIQVKVQFGEFSIPFLKLRNHILQGKREFQLPNGEIALIPEWWFTKFSELFALLEQNKQHELTLRNHHLMLVQQLGQESLASVVIDRKLEKLRDFEQIKDYQLPESFRGTLRPYQKAGYDWLKFLNEFRLGGCLADDMGLGKTVQTLALLQSEKEAGITEPNLLILPTSLLYNWALESGKFTPDLRILHYTGTSREKNTAIFRDYDLILTTYGVVRLDIELLKTFRFNYIILDESQAIKNPTSNIAKAVGQLNSAHRLILTGTPLENSTMDLWSQMSFVNPGLLGNQAFFRNQYLLPIEKQNDEKAAQKLFNTIKPFILRRHKSQVATDLPEKIESIQFTSMSELQEKAYEEAKSRYRNLILEQLDREGMAKSQMVVLQGLIRLRQIANHPSLADETYEGDSGKFRDVFHKLETALQEDHKVLIFSQFTQHLALFRKKLDHEQIRYTYLDGSTVNRQQQVEEFQTQESVKVFLISLKAGGVGLNLTAADYVFILDPWWNPAAEAQAIDRAHRIGQDKTVFTYKFISQNTVEEKILAMQQRKRQLASDLISTEESFVKSLSREDILSLLE